MVFTSLGFVGLFVPAFLCWHLLQGRARLLSLLLASYAFYGAAEPWFLLLLLFSTALDYTVGLRLQATEDPPTRRSLLALSITGNLGILMYYKYLPLIGATLGLVDSQVAAASQTFHVSGHIPIGLSFYTFQTLGYTLDVYRRKTPACRDPLAFAVFVSFFPQLVAGPVVRAQELIPQLVAERETTSDEVVQGVELFAVGLFKKLVIADNLGLAIDGVFADPLAWTAPTLALATVLFCVQIYADFSGYSTMARGLGRMFGIVLPRNFYFPWLAGDPLGYRRGWHMTMAHWFRDHVYFPLGGSRGSALRANLNLLLVWFLFGMWHGASWSFGMWGLYNGLVQIVYRSLTRRGLVIPDYPGKRVAGVVLVAAVLMPSVLFFRLPSVEQSFAALWRVLTFQLDGAVGLLWCVPVLAGLAAVHTASYLWYDEDLLNRVSWPVRWALLGAITLAVVFGAPEQRPFVYFQF